MRRIPTAQQVVAILQSVRSQKFSAEAKDSGDFLEFLGTAGVGQAEAGDLALGDIEWEKNRIRFRRRKTQQIFYVPIFAHLKPLLERLCKQFPEGTPATQKIFKVKDVKKALAAACTRLGYHNFSQRSFRQALILGLFQSGVNAKSIAKWQGHQDGGKLIIDTYTEVVTDNDNGFENEELKKIRWLTPPSQ